MKRPQVGSVKTFHYHGQTGRPQVFWGFAQLLSWLNYCACSINLF